MGGELRVSSSFPLAAPFVAGASSPITPGAPRVREALSVAPPRRIVPCWTPASPRGGAGVVVVAGRRVGGVEQSPCDAPPSRSCAFARALPPSPRRAAPAPPAVRGGSRGGARFSRAPAPIPSIPHPQHPLPHRPRFLLGPPSRLLSRSRPRALRRPRALLRTLRLATLPFCPSASAPGSRTRR